MRRLLLVLLVCGLLATSAEAKAGGRTFTPTAAVDALEIPESPRVAGRLEAGANYVLLKTGGPAGAWCKVALPHGSGWVECKEGSIGAAVPTFAYYLLVLSWSPAFCAEHAGRSPEQCSKSYGFVVHGLWPQNERGWPESCSTPGTLDGALIEELLPLMPSKTLVEHEWAKHGTCSGLGPRGYLALLERARSSIAIPPVLNGPRRPVSATLEQIRSMFIAVNPGLTADAMAVACKTTVSEVRFCLDKELRFRRCSADVRDRCQGVAIFPPIR
jgi:ribonuclease T2